MNNHVQNFKAGSIVILVILLVSGGCLFQNSFFGGTEPENLDQCVTPLFIHSPFSVLSDSISITSDGSLIAVLHSLEGLYLFDRTGSILWSSDNFGGRSPLITDDGNFLITQIRRQTKEDRFFLVKIDVTGSILWENEIGLIGVDGIAITPDSSFIVVGYVDQNKNGHLMLFDGDGTKLWDHQIDGRIETVAVSKTGYVAAGPRDRYIYVYDSTGDLIFNHYAGNFYDTQDTVIAPDESYFLFGSEHKYLNCYTLEGDLLWQEEVGAPCNIRISADAEYIVVATDESTLFLFDKNGTKLWSKKVTDAFFIEEVAISAHAEYIAINAKEKNFLSQLYITVYSRQGELLWRYEGSQPFKAIAISDDGHYIAAGNSNALVFFDNFAAIEEYKSSECAQSHKDEQFKVCIC